MEMNRYDLKWQDVCPVKSQKLLYKSMGSFLFGQ